MSRSWVRVLLIALGVAVAVWVMFWPLTFALAGPDLHLLDAKDRMAAVSSIRSLFATALGPLFVAGGLFYTARKFGLDRDKQYTDRYTNAVNHLGSADVTVRAGGIRALDRILHESLRDRARILKTVTGYLRTHTNVDSDILDDIAAAIDLLRDRGEPPRGQRDQLDLHGVRLADTDLAGIMFQGADLTGADLSGADLRRTDLRDARLKSVTAVKADFTSAILAQAQAAKAVLTDANFTRADLRTCELSGAVLSGAKLDGALLDDATLVSTDLTGADLRSARGLVPDQLRRTRTDAATALPPGVVKPTSD